MYIRTYVCDPVRLWLRHLYQVEICSFIVRFPTAEASVYCGHIFSLNVGFHSVSSEGMLLIYQQIAEGYIIVKYRSSSILVTIQKF